jgi:large subunit ribosomal protein L45
MSRGLRYKTLRWKWIEEIEPSYVVAIKSGEILKGMTMAQVTIRMHSKQTCAIYDRFGRLMFGNETVPKDILEYVIFERVLTFPYSQWRVHSKIIPSWLPATDPLLYTFEKPRIELLEENTSTDKVEDEKKRDQITKEQETITKTIPAPNELKTPLPTISNISQPNKKRTVGYT